MITQYCNQLKSLIILTQLDHIGTIIIRGVDAQDGEFTLEILTFQNEML